MTDAIISSNDREEALSFAYVQAVAAGAGYTVSTSNLDRDGVDLQIRAGGSMRPSLDIQLKATTNLGAQQSGTFPFRLKVRNYELLRVPTLVPRILVVLDLPPDHREWLTISQENLILRRCAYWASVVGEPGTPNSESVTVSVPSENRFDVGALRALMEQARKGAVV